MSETIDEETMTPEMALARMAAVTTHTRSLRVRTEGLTIAVWGLIMAASYLTIVIPIVGGLLPPRGPGEPSGPPPEMVFLATRLAPLAWFAVGVLFTTAIWKSASLTFQTGLSTPHLVGVFIGWLALFALTVLVLVFAAAENPRSWHLVGWGVVIGLLALLNPLRFTSASRTAIALVAATALLTGVYAQAVDLPARDVGVLAGIALGAPALATGLTLMIRG